MFSSLNVTICRFILKRKTKQPAKIVYANIQNVYFLYVARTSDKDNLKACS